MSSTNMVLARYSQCTDDHHSTKMTTFNEQTIAELYETFSLFDELGDGQINLCQLADVLRAVGKNPTKLELEKCTSQLKADARISFDTFLPIVQSISKSTKPSTQIAEDFIEVFRHFDTEGNGCISSGQMRNVLTCLGDKLTTDEAEELLGGHSDSFGNVNYEDFVRFVMNG